MSESTRKPLPLDRPCRRCGLPMQFLYSPAGKPLPVVRVRVVYRVGPKPKELQKVTIFGVTPPDEAMEVAEIYVSHFETCPHASEFSSGRTP